LAQIIENGYATVEQCAAVFSWLDASRVALKQTNPEGMFQLGNGSGNRRLSRIEERCRFAHAACLHSGHKDVEIVQLQSPPDTIAYLHIFHPLRTGYRDIRC
jgi:hypothetical protein